MTGYAHTSCCTANGDSGDAKVQVIFEVSVKSTSVTALDDIKGAVQRYLEGKVIYQSGLLDIHNADDDLLVNNVERIYLTRTDAPSNNRPPPLFFWQVEPRIYCYQVNEEGPVEDDEHEDGVPTYHEWFLPSRDFEGMWETLYYDSEVKQQLLKYASSALLFSDFGINQHTISWNRMVLLHGPPGTGKTSLCKALAQKLSILFSTRYQRAQLIEVNAHSLFSKYFSESGKLVSKLFTTIAEMVEEPGCLVFVLIDEVESLTSARKAAVSGSEPSDSIRAVNALLTQLDGLKRFPNAMVMTTSNITEAIDVAFMDRADIKAYIGPPSQAARYQMLRSALQELIGKGLVSGCRAEDVLPWSEAQQYTQPPSSQSMWDDPLYDTTDSNKTLRSMQAQICIALAAASMECNGLSGRSLRKVPFLAHALSEQELPIPCDALQYIAAMQHAAAKEGVARSQLAHG